MNRKNDAKIEAQILMGLFLIAAMFAAVGSLEVGIWLMLIAGVGLPMGLMLRFALDQASPQQTDVSAADHEHQNNKT